jgi:hypothetical protein
VVVKTLFPEPLTIGLLSGPGCEKVKLGGVEALSEDATKSEEAENLVIQVVPSVPAETDATILFCAKLEAMVIDDDVSPIIREQPAGKESEAALSDPLHAYHLY